jgi:hypothetical protein
MFFWFIAGSSLRVPRAAAHVWRIMDFATRLVKQGDPAAAYPARGAGIELRLSQATGDSWLEPASTNP